jgi:hypothetical protein
MTDCGKTENKGCWKGFKIGCLSVVAMFLIIVFAGVWWFFYVTRDVKVHDEDMVVTFENVLEKDNGYFALERARQMIVESELDVDAFYATNDIPSDENLNAYRLFIEKNPDVLDTFYSVAGYEYCQAPLEEGVPLIAQKGLRVSRLIALGNLSLCHVENLIREGNYSEALDCLSAHLRAGQMINSGGNNLLTGMLGLVINRMAKDLLISHLSEGSFPNADYAQIQKMMSDLDRQNNWEHMIRAEYSVSKSVVLSLSQEMNLPPNIPRRFGRYVYNESVVLNRLAQYFREIMASVDNPDIQPSTDFFKTDISEGDATRLFLTGNAVSQILYSVLTPSGKNIGPTIADSWTKDELINLYLALWQYQMDHRVLPDKLEEIVPEYISELPVDPFGKGAVFLYDPQRKVIYSAGVESSENQDDLRISLGFVR